MTRSAPTPPLLQNVRIILVETQEPGNLGAAARAMMNMGMQRLRLLNCCDQDHPQCRALAGKAYQIIDHAERFDDWEEAVSDVHLLIGTTSARERLLQRPVLPVREAAAQLASQAAASNAVGVVFGPERTGLSEWHLSRCQVLASIPSHPEHPVLNLAQAVMVFCYEISLALRDAEPVETVVEGASQEQRQQMFEQAQALLTRIGFLSTSNPEPIMSLLRSLPRRDLSAREVRTVRGILSQLEWFIESGRELPPDKIRRK